MSLFELYLIFQADLIHGLFVGATLIAGLACFVSWLMHICPDKDENENLSHITLTTRKWMARIGPPVFLVSVFLWAFFPTTDRLIAVYGLHTIAESASNVEGLDKLPQNLLDYMNAYLEKEVGKMDRGH